MKIFSARYLVLLVLAVALLSSGCETVGKAKRDQAMNFRLKEYAHEVRWGALEALPSYLKPDLVETQPPVAEDPSNVRVTDYEVLRYPTPVEDDRVTQTVRIGYLFRDRQVVRTLVDQQTWEYDAETGQWFRANAIPPFE